MKRLPEKYCDPCRHPEHPTWPCDVVKTSARLGWSSRCECSNYGDDMNRYVGIDAVDGVTPRRLGEVLGLGYEPRAVIGFEYQHDGGPQRCWLEIEQDWDAARNCYRTVVRTDDATDHARLPMNLRYLYSRNILEQS